MREDEPRKECNPRLRLNSTGRLMMTELMNPFNKNHCCKSNARGIAQQMCTSANLLVKPNESNYRKTLYHHSNFEVWNLWLHHNSNQGWGTGGPQTKCVQRHTTSRNHVVNCTQIRKFHTENMLKNVKIFQKSPKQGRHPLASPHIASASASQPAASTLQAKTNTWKHCGVTMTTVVVVAVLVNLSLRKQNYALEFS